MNLETIKVALVAVLLAWCALATWAWDHEVRAFAKFRSDTEALGNAALNAKKEVEQAHEKVVIDVSQAWDKARQSAGETAVAAYAAAHPGRVQQCAGGGALPVVAGGAQGADGASGERLPAEDAPVCEPDASFIQSCARDAAKVGMWQAWAVGMRLPVE